MIRRPQLPSIAANPTLSRRHVFRLGAAAAAATVGGGMVSARVTGDLVVQSIKIDPAAIDPDDAEMLEDLVLAAVNEALRMAQELAQNRMGGLTSGLDLGGLGLPGLGL